MTTLRSSAAAVARPRGLRRGRARPAGGVTPAWRPALCGVAVVLATTLLVVQLLAAREIVGARGAARAAERALHSAGDRLRDGEPDAAARDLGRARHEFERVRGHVQALRSLLGAAGRIPVVDDQACGADTLAIAGLLATRAGMRIASAAGPASSRGGARDVVRELRRVRFAAVAARGDVAAALGRVRSLRDVRLVGPVGAAATSALRSLLRLRRRLRGGVEDLSALVTFLGGDGPRRYLVLSQNPAEPRPGGGFIGTYGVLAVADGRPRLERYRSIESWYRAHREAQIAPADAPLVFQRGPARPQTIANVNATPHWPASARLAAALWQRGGERRVDGVISFTPELVARALRILGPLRPRGYRRTVTAANVIETLDFYTHQARHGATGRKRFVTALAHELTLRLATRGVRWPRLARAVGRGLAAREAVAWSRDAGVQRTLARHRFDGALPPASGDFFADAEFAGASKDGRGLRRRFDHVVALRADGSARIATTMTVGRPAGSRATARPRAVQSYVTLYGPRGGVLQPSSDPPVGPEAAIAGHPAWAWLRATPPGAATSLRAVWEAPRVLVRGRGGALVYRLHWMRVPAHAGDVLRLDVRPPRGWHWAGRRPPRAVALRADVRESWRLTR
ncbi:MAG: hypothetical protein QOI48_327 [Solirubrobacteraceae bacterium]|nr:hypothetical protein [Solirubrobacteraceae bacterium]